MTQIINENTAALQSVTRTSNTLKKSYAPSIVSGHEANFDFEDEVISSQAYRRAFYAFVGGIEGAK